MPSLAAYNSPRKRDGSAFLVDGRWHPIMFRRSLAAFSLLGLVLSIVLWTLSFGFGVYIAAENTLTFEAGALCWAHVVHPGATTHAGWHWQGFTAWSSIYPYPKLLGAVPGIILPSWIPIIFFLCLLWASGLSRYRPAWRRRALLWICRRWPGMIPELDLLAGEAERRLVLEEAYGNRPVSATYVVASALFLFAVVPYVRGLCGIPTAPLPAIIVGLEIACYPSLVALVALFLLKRKLRPAVRQELLKKGIALCLHCGRDLRGQSGSRCPKCGTDR